MFWVVFDWLKIQVLQLLFNVLIAFIHHDKAERVLIGLMVSTLLRSAPAACKRGERGVLRETSIQNARRGEEKNKLKYSLCRLGLLLISSYYQS